MKSFEQHLDFINQYLQHQEMIRTPESLYIPVEYALSMGGKRLRPALALMACEMFGGEAEKAKDVALGLEIFHNFTLLHDDLMDDAPIRRGKATVYRKWSANTAILSGDAMFALAYEYIVKVSPEALPSVMSCFNKIALGVCEGQQYDMDFETAEEVLLSDYMEMIRLKTAVLLGGALKLGAILADAKAENLKLIYDFGIYIGLAFQLQDDLLDLYGDEDSFGKKIGGDIRVNKKTFLYLKALELAGSEDRAKLKAYFSDVSCDPEEKIKTIASIYQSLDIKKQTEKEIQQIFDFALACMKEIPIDEEHKKPLLDLAAKLLDREY